MYFCFIWSDITREAAIRNIFLSICWNILFLYETKCVCSGDPPDDVIDPRPARIDQSPRHDGAAGAAAGGGHLDPPQPALAPGRGAGGAGQHFRALFRRIAGVERNQLGIFDPAIGIFVAAQKFGFQGNACSIASAATS